MKLLLSLVIAGATLFAGGNIQPMKVVKYEKPQTNCFKPNIQKCPDCKDVAELCPYNGEDLPIAKTEPCEALLNQPAN